MMIAAGPEGEECPIDPPAIYIDLGRESWSGKQRICSEERSYTGKYLGTKQIEAAGRTWSAIGFEVTFPQRGPQGSDETWKVETWYSQAEWIELRSVTGRDTVSTLTRFRLAP
ncbi:MAG: hypothetical protein ACLGH3_03885 [Actinomycetota bacterium]